MSEGGLKETMQAIQDAARASIPQTKELAQKLKADTDEQTFYNIWHFLKTRLKYKLDKNGMEQVRTAARSWADRKKGIDCEDFAIFAYALLTNLGYSPQFEIVAFNGKKEYGHIYVIVNGFTIDAVMDLFDKKPNNITKTKHMDIYGLTGVNSSDFGALGARRTFFNPTVANAGRQFYQRYGGRQTQPSQQAGGDAQLAAWWRSYRQMEARLKSFPSGAARSGHWAGSLGRQMRKVRLLTRSLNPQTRPTLQNLVYNYIFDYDGKRPDSPIRWKGNTPDDIKKRYPTLNSMKAQGLLAGLGAYDMGDVGGYEVSGLGQYDLSGLGEYALAGVQELGEIGLTYVPTANAIYGIGAVAPPDAITQGFMREASQLLAKIMQESQGNPDALRTGRTARRWRKLRFLIKLNGMPQERAIVARIFPFIKDVNLQNYTITFKNGVTDNILEDYNALKQLQSWQRRGVAGLGSAEISAIDQAVSAVDTLLGADDVRAAQEQIGSFFSKIGKGLKNAINKIKKFQPLRFAAKIGLAPIRGAFLLLLRVNLFKMASMLKYGYVTDEQVKRLGLSTDAVNRARNTIKKLKQIWYDVGGDPEVLKNTIIKGGGGLSGVEIIQGLGAAPFAAALATAAPIIAKVKMLLSAAMPAIKAIANRMKAAKEGAPPPPQPPSTEPLQPQTESVQGLGEVDFHGADDIAAYEMGELLNGIGRFSFKNLFQKAAALIAPKPQPYNYPQVFNNPPAQPNFNAQAPQPQQFAPQPQQFAPQPQQFAPQPDPYARQAPPAQPSGFEKIVNVAQAVAPNSPVVQAAAALVAAKQNVNNPPTPQADGYQNAGEQAAAQEMQRQGGDGAPGPGDTNVISPAGGAAEPKKNNTLLYVGGAIAAAAVLYVATK
ncbi:MAG: hypothetical protein IPP15_16015 [Saprospiraceae bacterium]|uniref:Transglutaminase-like domain-containing protein n=1 Tax=Candidatus Opimibacter skivensis TaxID=2982028 RepID=A0A9D7XTM4_9BACT|nr:hypothetical protein [Candidatus Opimibacter skivensis]